MSNVSSAGAKFRAAVAAEKPLQVIGAINAYHARLAERTGYKAIYLSGGGVAAGSLGLPDLGITTLDDVLTDVRRITDACGLPLLVDADTGFGSAFNIARTVKSLIKFGAGAMHIEDQVQAKRCGHRPGKEIVSRDEMVDRIKAAVDARTDPDFVIIARTDARAVTSLDDAIDRGNRAAEAGADVIFVEAPQTDDEIQRVAREVKAPLLANMVQGGRTPAVKVAELERIGFKIVIFPAVCMAAAVPAMERALTSLKETGTDWHDGPVLSPMDIFRRVGFDWWHAIEEKFAPRS